MVPLLVTRYAPDPMYSYEFPQEYLKRVKETHETGGGYGSVGSVDSTRYMKLVFAAIDSVTLLVPLKVPVWVETGRSSEEHPANSHHCCQCQNALQTGATGILYISNYSVMKVEISKCNLCTTGVYPGKVFLNRSGVSQWDTGCHTSGWVSSDWGTSGWPQPYPRWPHGHAVRVLQQNG